MRSEDAGLALRRRSDGEPSSVEPIALSADLVEIVVSPGHDYWTEGGAGRLRHGYFNPPEVECVAGRGLIGDRYFDHPEGHDSQVTFISAEALDDLRARFNLPNLPAGVLRRNLVVRGADLSTLVGRRFRLQEVEFEGVEECLPCVWMNRVVGGGAEHFLRENFRGGLRARVVTDGTLRTASWLDAPRPTT